MGWWRKLRTMWPFGVRQPSTEAVAAVKAAELSQKRALGDRAKAAVTLAEAQKWAAEVKAHNVANRYDDMLQRLVQGRD